MAGERVRDQSASGRAGHRGQGARAGLPGPPRRAALLRGCERTADRDRGSREVHFPAPLLERKTGCRWATGSGSSSMRSHATRCPSEMSQIAWLRRDSAEQFSIFLEKPRVLVQLDGTDLDATMACHSQALNPIWKAGASWAAPHSCLSCRVGHGSGSMPIKHSRIACRPVPGRGVWPSLN